VVDRNRTPSKYVGYALYFFYFSGLLLRQTAAEGLSSCVLSKEITFPYGTDGFKSSNDKGFYQRKQMF